MPLAAAIESRLTPYRCGDSGQGLAGADYMWVADSAAAAGRRYRSRGRIITSAGKDQLLADAEKVGVGQLVGLDQRRHRGPEAGRRWSGGCHLVRPRYDEPDPPASTLAGDDQNLANAGSGQG